MIGFPVLLGLCLGCSAPSLEGRWTVTPATPTVIPTTITATFAKPDQLSVTVKAVPEGPTPNDVTADVVGTWQLSGDTLTVEAAEVSVTGADGKELPHGFFGDEIRRQVKEAVTTSATGKLKWDGPDRVTVTTTDNKSAVLSRIKS